MLAWVGFVFGSPLMDGTSETCSRAKLSLPTRNWNCRIASTNGADSMSPTVPPSYERTVSLPGGTCCCRPNQTGGPTSMMQTSGACPDSSTGF